MLLWVTKLSIYDLDYEDVMSCLRTGSALTEQFSAWLLSTVLLESLIYIYVNLLVWYTPRAVHWRESMILTDGGGKEIRRRTSLGDILRDSFHYLTAFINREKCNELTHQTLRSQVESGVKLFMSAALVWRNTSSKLIQPIFWCDYSASNEHCISCLSDLTIGSKTCI